jgi:hypothetical protein
MEAIIDFIARLHSLVVHLPVAILPIAALLTIRNKIEKSDTYESFLLPIWLLAAFSASAACITGLLTTQPVGLHKWMGLMCAFGAIGYSLALLKGKQNFKGVNFFVGFLMVLTLVTMYFGATITYGERFLVKKNTAITNTFEKEITTFAANDVPTEFIEPANMQTLESLRKMGFLLLPVGGKSNYLSVNTINVTNFTDEKAKLLVPLSNHIVWLKLGDTPITDSTLALVGQMKNLSRLHLERTKISDLGLQYLLNLPRLYLLNLTGTEVSNDGVQQLSALQQLKFLYLFKTKVKTSDWTTFKANFPNTALDTGGYVVPTLNSDTVMLKDPKAKK